MSIVSIMVIVCWASWHMRDRRIWSLGLKLRISTRVGISPIGIVPDVLLRCGVVMRGVIGRGCQL